MTLVNEIYTIKLLRTEFLKKFNLNSNTYELLTLAVNDVNLHSIRVHKYLTDTGLIGKVKTAKFLESIDLSEKTMIKELSDHHIKQINSFVSNI